MYAAIVRAQQRPAHWQRSWRAELRRGHPRSSAMCQLLPGLLRDLYRSSRYSPPAGTAIFSRRRARITDDWRRSMTQAGQRRSRMSGSNSSGQRMATMPPSMPKSSRPMRGDGYSPRHAARSRAQHPSPSARPRGPGEPPRPPAAQRGRRAAPRRARGDTHPRARLGAARRPRCAAGGRGATPGPRGRAEGEGALGAAPGGVAGGVAIPAHRAARLRHARWHGRHPLSARVRSTHAEGGSRAG